MSKSIFSLKKEEKDFLFSKLLFGRKSESKKPEIENAVAPSISSFPETIASEHVPAPVLVFAPEHVPAPESATETPAPEEIPTSEPSLPIIAHTRKEKPFVPIRWMGIKPKGFVPVRDLLEHNAENIGPEDEFVSVYLRMKELMSRIWWDASQWREVWASMSVNPIFNAAFRARLCEKLASLKGKSYRYGDLSVIEPLNDAEDMSFKVLNFLHDSDFLQYEGVYVFIQDEEDICREDACATLEDFQTLQGFSFKTISCLEKLLDSADDLMTSVTMLDEISVELHWTEKDMLRILNYKCFESRLKELIEGTTDAIVLFSLPRNDGIFVSSHAQHIQSPFLRGAMQELILERDEPLIMMALKDVGTVRMGHTVHHALHDRMVNEGLTEEAKTKYKNAYSIVRPLPTTKDKTSIMKPYEWAAIALKVFGMDPVVQQLVMEAVGESKKKSALTKLEKMLSDATDIDAMVNALRMEAKANPFVLRLWGVDLNAEIPVWVKIMEEVSTSDLWAIARMLEYKIFAAGLTVKEGSRTMFNLLISAVEMNDMKSSFFKPVCNALYVKVKNQSHKRSRHDLESFVEYVGKVVGEGNEDEEGSYESDPELLRCKLAKRVRVLLE